MKKKKRKFGGTRQANSNFKEYFEKLEGVLNNSIVLHYIFSAIKMIDIA